MAELISMREFSRRVGVQLRAVQFAIETGRIKIAERRPAGKQTRVFIDWETQAQAWEQNRDPGKKNRPTSREMAQGTEVQHTGEKKTKPSAGAQAHSSPGRPKADAPPSQYQIARSAREAFNAKMAELNYKKSAGALVELDKVKALYFDIARTVQQNLLNIPGRVSAIVSAKTDEREIYNLIEKEIMLVLESLSNANFNTLSK